MKKPDIEIVTEYGEGKYNAVTVNGMLLCLCDDDNTSNAVRELIEALISCVITFKKHVRVERSPELTDAIEALKKAGVITTKDEFLNQWTND